MTRRIYLTPEQAIKFHKILIERYGGASGIRDMPALESAIFRPQNGYYEDIIEEAAALFESLVINHPFIDGNKRVAFAVTDAFLRINDYRIDCQWQEIYRNMMEMFDSNTFDKEHVEPWLRTIVVRVSC